MTVLVWLGVWAAASIVLVAAWCAGHTYGFSKGRAFSRQVWEQAFLELGVEHGHTIAEWEALVDELEDQLIRADLTINKLHDDNAVAFLAGQQIRADREAWGLD